MPDLNPDHPSYDPAKEILGFLPKHPTQVSSAKIAKCLGMKSWQDMLPHFNRLRHEQYDVHIKHKSPNEKMLWVGEKGWKRVQDVTKRYFRKVYGL